MVLFTNQTKKLVFTETHFIQLQVYTSSDGTMEDSKYDEVQPRVVSEE